MRLATLLLCAALLVPALSRANGRAATQLGHDARAEGLGGLSSTLETGSLSLQANPAALAGLAGPEAAFTHQAWLADTHQEDLALATPFGDGLGLGAQVGWFGVPGFDGTGGTEAAVDASLMSLDLGAAQRFSSLGGVRLGASISYFQQRLDDVQSKDLALNLGFMAPTPIDALSLGAAVRQLGLWQQADGALPTLAVAGAALDFGFLMLGVEEQLPFYGVQPKLRGGVEWRLHKALALRAGLSSDEAPDQAMAPDFGLGLAWGRLGLDLASTGRGALGNTVSATLRLSLAAGATPEPTPAATVVPTPKPTAVPTPRPKPVAVAPVRAPEDGEGDWDGGGFILDATVQGEVVTVSWPDLLKEYPEATGYNVYISLVPRASMRLLNKDPQKSPLWQGEMGMRGMTYYFRVKIVGPAGTVLAVSRIKAVLMP